MPWSTSTTLSPCTLPTAATVAAAESRRLLHENDDEDDDDDSMDGPTDDAELGSPDSSFSGESSSPPPTRSAQHSADLAQRGITVWSSLFWENHADSSSQRRGGSRTIQRPNLRKARSEAPHNHNRDDSFPTVDLHNAHHPHTKLLSTRMHHDLDHSSQHSVISLNGTTAAATTTGTTSGAHSAVAPPSHHSMTSHSTTNSTTTVTSTAVRQLLIGASGIYGSYLYYGHVQEDLFRYRQADTGQPFNFFWALQMAESFVTLGIGYVGRKCWGSGSHDLPLVPFFKSGASQLVAKAFMSMSLAAGLSFPVVTLAKSAKIVPVMLGQFILGGSSYTLRDYTFAILIVVGTSLLSAGKTSHKDNAASKDTLSGLILIVLSLVADGFTGGLQKKLKRLTASMAPTTYDFLYYSHLAQLVVATVIGALTGELSTAPAYLVQNPSVQWLVLASCICSAIGQCFIFYTINCFDPLVTTTITTTRKLFTVLLSIGLKGHILSSAGFLGLGLACTALLMEVEGKLSAFREKHKQKRVDPSKSASIPLPS
jgi:solute carrier family 35 (UDP-galactose transporter), member B1